MHLKEVLNKCKEMGYPISAMGLYNAGHKNGFLISSEGSRSLEFDKEKFLEWLHKALEEIPEGWISVKQLKERYKISMNEAYNLVNDENSGAKYIGSGKGVLYVDPERIEKIIKERKENNKYEWEEK